MRIVSTITIEQLHELFIYEPDTGRLLNRVSTNSRARAGAEAGSDNGRGYLQLRVCGKALFVHRVIFAMHHGRWPSAQLDHIDNDKANNRLENLREATPAENSRNVGARGRNTSGIVGVHPDGGKWRTMVSVNGRDFHLGRFREKMMAADTYGYVARHVHADFLHPTVPVDPRITAEVLELLIGAQNMRLVNKAIAFNAAMKQVATALSVQGATV